MEREQESAAPATEVTGAEEVLVPDEHHLNHLLQLRISEEIARKALTSTRNASLTKAIVLARELEMADAANWEDIPDFKMVFIVNTSFQMGTGTISMQVADAAIKLYSILNWNQTPQVKEKMQHWKDGGSRKAAMAAKSEQELRHLKRKAKKLRVPHVTVKSVERSELDGNHILVLALFGSDTTTGKIANKLPSL